MNVVKFARRSAPDRQGWQSAELQRLMSACEPYIPEGQASGWDFGLTERGDPQMYLLGPAPDHDCILSISRLGRHYVLEDGNGRILFEHDNLVPLAEQACQALRRRKGAMVARIAVAWCAMREFIEEKVEPVMAEPLELVTHVAPQFAWLA